LIENFGLFSFFLKKNKKINYCKCLFGLKLLYVCETLNGLNYINWYFFFLSIIESSRSDLSLSNESLDENGIENENEDVQIKSLKYTDEEIEEAKEVLLSLGVDLTINSLQLSRKVSFYFYFLILNRERDFYRKKNGIVLKKNR